MNNHSIGLMQGRLTKPNGRGIQFFPFENWQEEFRIAKILGLKEIEWIFDLDKYKENPLWTKSGRGEIINIIKKTGVKVNFICADYFMNQPFIKTSEKICAENVAMVRKLTNFAKEIGARAIEIPCLDNSSIKTPEEEATFIACLLEFLPTAQKQNIDILLEIDYPPKKILDLLKKLENRPVGITYDSGNSSGIGYDAKDEIMTYGKYIGNVHIKDRLKGNGTKALGTGSANFDKVFSSLKAKKYHGNYILQVARGDEGKETETVKYQMKFVEKYLKKYKL